MSIIQPVILSGGSGTRLWPLSRESYPKQFLPLAGEQTMLQATWQRVAPIASRGPLVIANEEHRFVAAEQLHQVGAEPAAIILEPMGRNTAPAIAVAALEATRDGADALLLVLPSDHVISDEATFRSVVQAATSAAEAGKLVTFGIVPTGPETGYGYIKAADGQGLRAVERFVEKPDLDTATGYVASGQYYWNSGMFLFKASRYLQELERFQPEMLAGSRSAWQQARRDTDFTRLDKAAFAAVASDSIDYAVMEKTADAVVIPLDAGWNDVGSWTALRDVSQQDGDGNAHQGDVIAIDCRNTYAYGQRLVAMVGLDDVIVVETDDAVLVGKADRMQEVKTVVSQLKTEGRSEATWHRKVYRPWGAYDSIDNGARFQVKRITVKPGGTLSLQMHHHRAEHWIVVSGTAEVTRGDEVILLSENQSTYIPLGVTHRLRNPGKLPLELIEVQSGSYLGEDDIVRFEDTYGRS
ncbi:mannose-1-phosphate guanylyltransferase/mannose-6-phosphate isomerase [Stenotrophomonas maltophilia]|jgi:mannose-1-phosphate guanylyltransferase/mannose-6-phosphate isomerase|uniref:mannose-1-phosphate guanylyltransferase/mannose-6-phosphate isomerase n=1 Tax=Stenotrophomonas maltophilia group TaxID=995085 RepID=UPI0013DBB701|nr:mannose-1-phosphate guanylyltransferase/mannose-6-phosphate isomerase [Stenotrophomonas maltophilia]MBA0386360.1 mannose-1-phosphate guanylyltransferase/mannose-6-phosphate isomerase [Stenotrophomonas maltophilia]MBA0390625.1 mannose-1-phosphate guanylyltransferase/mannose-6-phosphate isomerase [Stenotrophomonas maltophilia]MBA0463436.1 mannose-1-phosphate guanylyltransferase/mannose-6-phosphate isomerase [Stenotrophomonas maltophilia]MBA0471532.1 mannose-1-phosphate guanylyltransferase/mann